MKQPQIDAMLHLTTVTLRVLIDAMKEAGSPLEYAALSLRLEEHQIPVFLAMPKNFEETTVKPTMKQVVADLQSLLDATDKVDTVGNIHEVRGAIDEFVVEQISKN